MKHVAYTLLMLASIAFAGMMLVRSANIWPPDLDRALWTLTLFRWAVALGVVGGFVGLGVLIVTAATTPEGKR